jgi:site-specific recombinase XerD
MAFTHAIEDCLATTQTTHKKTLSSLLVLLTLYNSGARVSEITSLTCNQVSFGASTFVQLTGKGRKERTVPLWPVRY